MASVSAIDISANLLGIFKRKISEKIDPHTTLDALHEGKLKKFGNKTQDIKHLQEKLKTLSNNREQLTDDVKIWHMEREINSLRDVLKKMETGEDMDEYIMNTGDILFNYYDIQEKIERGSTFSKKNNKKPGSILNILEKISDCPSGGFSRENVPQRNELLKRYIDNEDNLCNSRKETENDNWTTCEICGKEMRVCTNEANLFCTYCGNQEFVLIDSDKPSYKDPPREISYYAYKKINHFNEWLAQFQAKESTEVPQEIYDMIFLQLKKERIVNMSTLKYSKLREILRNLKYSKYYEHIPHIINRLNGQKAPFMSRESEEKLRHMFREIQPSFRNHCPKGRRNFLSYSYVLYKFCELLEMDEFLTCFTLLKNREKLMMQDKIWQKICNDMKWQYIKTI